MKEASQYHIFIKHYNVSFTRLLTLEPIETRNPGSLHDITLSKCIGKREGETRTRVNCRTTSMSLIFAKNIYMFDSRNVNFFFNL